MALAAGLQNCIAVAAAVVATAVAFVPEAPAGLAVEVAVVGTRTAAVGSVVFEEVAVGMNGSHSRDIDIQCGTH